MEKIKHLFPNMEWSEEKEFNAKENQALELAAACFPQF